MQPLSNNARYTMASGAVMVTGARGFVGAALVRRLASAGFHVIAAPRRQAEEADPLDIDRYAHVDMSHCFCIVHLAARVHQMNDASLNPLAEYRRDNVEATLCLARRAAAEGVKRFVFISTIKVNGESTPLGKAFTEADTPNPQDPYAISKYEAEQGLMAIAVQTGLEVVVIRPPLVYGPGVGANFAALSHAVLRRWPLPLGAVNNKRSLVSLDNLVDFIVTCITGPEAANEVFLVSDGHDLSTTELCKGLAQAAGVRPRLIPVPVWLIKGAALLSGKQGAASRLCGSLQVDLTKAQDRLGWVPPVAVHQGLCRVFGGGAV